MSVPISVIVALLCNYIAVSTMSDNSKTVFFTITIILFILMAIIK